MPGFAIHIAVAKEYIKKHKQEIKNEEEFIKGTIAPDLDETMQEVSKDKSKTHYGEWGKYQQTTYFDRFFEDKNVDLNQDYWKGYLLHLIADYYFYKVYFSKETNAIQENNDTFYHDYDCLNKFLVEKYDIKMIAGKPHNFPVIEKYIGIVEGNGKYLEKDRIIKFIDEVSSK